MNIDSSWRQRLAWLLMAASGFAGLGDQVVWTQQCALWLGHEAAAVLAVVTAFFGGLGIGALLLGTRIERSAVPLRWYVACEVVIAVWSVVLLLLMPRASGWLLALTGVPASPVWQWTVAFCGSLLLLLPATAAMGATLPAMARVTASLQRRTVAALYAANTFGAVLGVLAAAFWLVPALGLQRSAAVCIALNLFCAVAALWGLPGTPSPLPSNTSAAGTGALARLADLACTGLLGIGYEVLVVRVLSQVSEDTVYTFAMLLAVYLVGTAVGAAAYQRWGARHRDAHRLRGQLLCALAVACLLGTASLWAAEGVKAGLLQALGPGMAPAVAAEALLAVAAFGLPTLVMGALFSHLVAGLPAGQALGRALGANTLGAAAAPLLFGVLLAPPLGPKGALLLVAAGYVALAVMAAPATWRRPRVWLPAATAAVLALAAPPLAFVDVPDGGHIVSYDDGVMAAVSVVEDAAGVLRLRIDNRQQEGSSATGFVDGRQAWLPLLLHAGPRQVLFLGLGTGMTASAAALDPGLQVDAVELLPEVIAASAHFARAARGEAGARLHLLAADARRYVRASDRRYDVIVADNVHPARSGSGALTTVEHFRAVRDRLAVDGLFCQWLPLHQLDLQTLRSIVRSFLAVYPGGAALLASNSLETPVLGLVSRADGARFDVARLDAVLRGRPGQTGYGIDDTLALFGSFVAGPAALAAFAGDAPMNTDDHPVVAYRAPRITYAPDSLPRDRLVTLLQSVHVAPADVVVDAPDAAWPARLAAYWTARDRFIDAGRAVHPAADVREMLAQVRAPLLAMLHISPDFRPAYDPLLRMALALAGSDVDAGRALLTDLAAVQPARPEAAAALRQLGAAAP